ncbi:hypothetical protein H5410_058882 [Solanum commersonii]|uniref:Uncharacterized protein n=1 Tax=Solanum commersonii TaxID=4109 RepID=A0A9J5W1A1_SOLCO|nr:hypothetical protein H5410_058882 [Solanum commersonii]
MYEIPYEKQDAQEYSPFATALVSAEKVDTDNQLNEIHFLILTIQDLFSSRTNLERKQMK